VPLLRSQARGNTHQPVSEPPTDDRPTGTRRVPGTGDGPVFAWLTAVAVVGATVVQINRGTGSPPTDTIWAEDGAIFYNQAIHKSFAGALFTPYNNYLHLVPRLGAAVVAAFPTEDAARMLATTAAFVVSLLALYVYWASASVLRSQWSRVLLAVLVVALPAAGYETNAALNDAHWYLMFACFWALVAPARTTLRLVLGALVAALAVLSDPLTALLLPLGALTAWRVRSWRTAWPSLVLAAGAIVQAIVGIGGQRIGRYSATSPADIPGIYVLRVIGSFAVGDRWLVHLTGPRELRAYAVLLVLAAAFAYGLWRADGVARLVVVAAVAYSVAFVTITLLLRGTGGFLPPTPFTLNGSRYFVLPILLLYSAALATIDRPWRRPADRPDERRAWAGTFGTATVVLVLVNFTYFSVRQAGPGWRGSLMQAAELCRAAHGEPVAPTGETLPAPGEVTIPTAPQVPAPHAFFVAMPCSRLR